MPIRIGLQRNTAPFSYSQGAGFRPIGYSVDLIREVFSDDGYRLDAVEVTSSTREQMLISKIIDIECGSTTITRTRLKTHAFSVPIFRTCQRIAIKSYVNASRDLRIIGIEGSTGQAALPRWSRGQHVFIGAPSMGQAVSTFCSDQHIDAIIGDELILRSNLFNHANSTLLDARIGKESYGFMMRRGDQHFARFVNSRLQSIFRTETGALLYRRWFEDELPGLGIRLFTKESDD